MSGTTMIGEFSEHHLVQVAKDLAEKKTEGFTLLDPRAEARIPKFDETELTIGRVLGRGGFCVVSEVTEIALKRGDREETSTSEAVEDEHIIHNVVQDRGFMAQHFVRQGKDYRYAIKRMQKASRKDPQVFINSIVDLALEARFLSVLRHPNIIKMRAMERGDYCDPNFFLILDSLQDFSVKMSHWKKQKGGGVKRLFDVKGKKKHALFVERLTVSFDLACALAHLHEMNVIYRDLKPENIGFDVRGDVKIFDFGLARELDLKEMQEDGTFQLTGETGSPRYMAPEVARSRNYNTTADTYSFAILLWEILKMETPYEGYTMKMLNKRVVEGGARPKIDNNWGKPLCELLEQSFVDNPARPSMSDIRDSLREVIAANTEGEIYENLDASRKSLMSSC